jgi:hypothetical protein
VRILSPAVEHLEGNVVVHAMTAGNVCLLWTLGIVGIVLVPQAELSKADAASIMFGMGCPPAQVVAVENGLAIGVWRSAVRA